MNDTLEIILKDFEDIIATLYNRQIDLVSLSDEFRDAGLMDTQQISYFTAQLAHESMKFSVTEENLNYSLSAIQRVWPKYFQDNDVDINDYVNNPEKLANRVYGGRMGNNCDGDGYKYRGRGYIQLTGKDNYTNFQKYLYTSKYNTDVLDDPDIVLNNPYAMLSALFFYQINALASICDFVELTKRINGGLNGLPDRQLQLSKIQQYIANKETC